MFLFLVDVAGNVEDVYDIRTSLDTDTLVTESAAH